MELRHLDPRLWQGGRATVWRPQRKPKMSRRRGFLLESKMRAERHAGSAGRVDFCLDGLPGSLTFPIEGFELVRAQRHFGSGDVLREVIGITCTGDRQHHR